MNSFNFSKWNSLIGWATFAIALATYTLTLEPTVSYWDCGEYISTAVKLEVGHPPGAPLYQMMGAVFSLFATSTEKIALAVKEGKISEDDIDETLFHTKAKIDVLHNGKKIKSLNNIRHKLHTDNNYRIR